MPETTAAKALAPRRIPTQKRSRERFERMLDVATRLITEKGLDAVHMSEIADQAEVSIGSLYQYFPDKAAIVYTLAERYNEQGRECVKAALAGIGTQEELHEALLGTVDGYYQMFLAEPAMRDIWRATQGDKALQALDSEDCKTHAQTLTDAMEPVWPTMNRGDRDTLAALVMEQLASAVRHAVIQDRACGDRSIAMFKRLLPVDLSTLVPHP